MKDKKVEDSSHELYVPPAKRANKTGTSPSSTKTESHCRTVATKPHLHSRSRFKGRQHSYHKHVTPDYEQNPKKWTKYDLKDDGTKGLKGMSADEVNRHAAFEFLHELKERNTVGDDTPLGDSQNSVESVASKITFKKPSSKKTAGGVLTRVQGGDSIQLDCHGSGVLRMAEYVVGRDKGTRRIPQAKRTLLNEGKRKTAGTVPSKASAVALSHLEEEEDA